MKNELNSLENTLPFIKLKNSEQLQQVKETGDPWHQSMEYLQAECGNGLQIWTVAENKVNKQLQTVDKGRPSSLGVLKCHHKPCLKKIKV